MKLVRFGERGDEKPGVLLDDGTRVDVSASGLDYDEEFFGGEGVERLRRWVEKNAGDLPRVESTVRLGAAICRSTWTASAPWKPFIPLLLRAGSTAK